jgi:RNA polymerase sigma factor (TIGR02999 family)
MVAPASPTGLAEEELRWRRVYRRLRSRARALMQAERVGHTLAPTALVHEMYLRAMKDRHPPRTPEAFLAASAILMRRILVDWARRRSRVKRGGDLQRIDLHPSRIVDPLSIEGVVAIDRAIDRLDAVDPEAAHVAILRHFGGLTIREVAMVVGVSRRKTDRLWAFARAWLARELDG